MAYELYKLKYEGITKNNVFFICDKETRKTAVIDPCCRMSETSKLLEKQNLKLTDILITHTHIDHTAKVAELEKQYHCNVHISSREASFYSYECNGLIGFEDMEQLQLGNTKITCILTPGHTFGSTCFLIDDMLFTGDTVFIEGCGICHGNGSSNEDMYRSIQRLKEMIKEDIRVYPAHTYGREPGEPFSFVLRNNIYFCFDDFDSFEKYRNRKGQNNLFHFI